MTINPLQEIISQIRTRIPEQGPLEYFVHHNTIHHYEHMNFFDAVKKAAVDFNANAFMPEEFYIHKYNLRVIKHTELIQSIQNFSIKNHLDLFPNIILRLLLDDKKLEPTVEQNRQIQEIQSQHSIKKPFFFNQAIQNSLGINIDFYTSPTIYRFLSSYFDYGSAYWFLENREEGMWKNFCHLHKKMSFFETRYKKHLIQILKTNEAKSAIDFIASILDTLSLKEEHVEEYLLELCIKYKGWGGFIKSIEEHPEWIKCHDIVPSFVEFTAIILACEYAAIVGFGANFLQVPMYRQRPLHSAGFLTRFLTKVDKYNQIEGLLWKALPYLTDFNRQEIFHKAYEQSFYNMFLVTYSGHPCESSQEHDYQVVCCLDEREESFRRYLEAEPECETFGCAGHFGLNISYKGFFDKHDRALCPVNVEVGFRIQEIPIKINSLYKILLLWGELQWLSILSSKTLIRGYFQALISGILTVIPFTLDIIDPRIGLHIKNKILNQLKSSVVTTLDYKKEYTHTDGIGIDFESRLNFAGTFLKMIGLTQDFSPVIFIIGHGSSSLNNPHEAAHDCGACGGGRGAPNARLMALILNEQEIRNQLKKRHNINIPTDTKFIGAYHNTCSDGVEFFDTDMNNLPIKLAQHIKKIGEAAAFDAQERCRRFSNLPIGKDPVYYLDYVQSRAVDLRQPRPEYGHATNALCIIGPRLYSRDLFLDRRAFLVSYSPEHDTNAENLKKLLSAVIPVCAGINLEYYFSFIDNEVYGCGTKLPHNINALIGVINGHMSDLRLGLPWQMVEIHQPVRLFVTIISSLQAVDNLLREDNAFTLLIHNEWINIMVHDPYTHKLWVYKDKKFKEHEIVKASPRYSQYDKKILTTRKHMDFGHIAHGT